MPDSRLRRCWRTPGPNSFPGTPSRTELGITRAAVWKCIRQMEAEGYRIETGKKGYRLRDDSDAVSKNAILRYLGDASRLYELEVLSTVDSTNTYLKRMAHELKAAKGDGDGPWRAVVASSQNAGRGRMGRTFVSPAGTGVYLSVFFTPRLSAQQAVRITTAAAVAACRAIEACNAGESPERQPRIKWVNDILIDGRKTCGILTEASVDLESGGMDWAIMGIGFNVYEPEGGFPEELKTIAGPIALTRRGPIRGRLHRGPFLGRGEREAPVMMKLRPHHLLCLQKYTGRGYDGPFTAHMNELVRRLTADPRS